MDYTGSCEAFLRSLLPYLGWEKNGHGMMMWSDPVKAYQFFSLARKGGLVLLGIYLAKSGWPLEDIGYWEALLFSVTLLGSFWLDAWLKVYLSSADEVSEKASSFHWITGKVLVFSFSMAVIWWLLKLPLQQTILPNAPSAWVDVFVVFSFLWLPSLVLPAFYLVKKRSRPIWLLSLYYLLFFPVAFVLGDRFWTDNGMASFGLVIWAIPLFILTIIKYLSGKGRLANPVAVQLWKKWRALVLYALLAVIAPLFDAWLVQFLFPQPETFAVFRYGAREFPLVSTFAAAVSTAMIPAVASHGKEALMELKQRVRRLIWMLYPVTILLMLSSGQIFEQLFSDDFRDSAGIFNIYLLLTISQLIILQPMILALGLERWLVRAAILELSLNVLLSLVLGYYFGISGIAVATVIAFLVEKIVLVAWLKKRQSINLLEYFPVDGFLAALILLLIWYGTIVSG